MGEVEFGLEVQLYVHVFHAILRLPPSSRSGFEGRHDIFYAVALLGHNFSPWLPGVAREALGIFLKIADDAVSLWSLKTAR